MSTRHVRVSKSSTFRGLERRSFRCCCDRGRLLCRGFFGSRLNRGTHQPAHLTQALRDRLFPPDRILEQHFVERHRPIPVGLVVRIAPPGKHRILVYEVVDRLGSLLLIRQLRWSRQRLFTLHLDGEVVQGDQRLHKRLGQRLAHRGDLLLGKRALHGRQLLLLSLLAQKLRVLLRQLRDLLARVLQHRIRDGLLPITRLEHLGRGFFAAGFGRCCAGGCCTRRRGCRRCSCCVRRRR